MTPLCDFHLHSGFSSDSEAAPQVMIEQAAACGLPGICFTDHNDFDYPPEDGKSVFQLSFDAYLEALCKLRSQYSAILPVQIGVEQGLSAGAADRINKYDAEGRLDFIIGSSHLVHGIDPYYPEFWANRPAKLAIRSYYESALENVSVCTNFDVYGHLDYILRYAPEKDSGYDWRDDEDLIDLLLRRLITQGKGLEVNTAGLRSGLKRPNPGFGILKKYRDLGGEILTVGSDAHAPQFIGSQFNLLPELLQCAGFRYYTVFRQRKPEFIKL